MTCCISTGTALRLIGLLMEILLWFFGGPKLSSEYGPRKVKNNMRRRSDYGMINKTYITSAWLFRQHLQENSSYFFTHLRKFPTFKIRFRLHFHRLTEYENRQSLSGFTSPPFALMPIRIRMHQHNLVLLRNPPAPAQVQSSWTNQKGILPSFTAGPWGNVLSFSVALNIVYDWKENCPPSSFQLVFVILRRPQPEDKPTDSRP